MSIDAHCLHSVCGHQYGQTAIDCRYGHIYLSERKQILTRGCKGCRTLPDDVPNSAVIPASEQRKREPGTHSCAAPECRSGACRSRRRTVSCADATLTLHEQIVMLRHDVPVRAGIDADIGAADE